MKKLIGVVCLFVSALALAQDTLPTAKKFQIAVHYAPILGESSYFIKSFDGTVGANVRYQFATAAPVNFLVGMDAVLLTVDRDAFSDVIILNPNIVAEFVINESNIRPFIAVGYHFFKTKLEIENPVFGNPNDPAFNSGDVDLKYSGITIQPGFRYHFNTIFVNVAYNYLLMDPRQSGEAASNLHLLNIGLGLKF